MGRTTFDIDWVSLLLPLLICSFGLFVLLSIDRSLFFQQALNIGIGLAIAIIISRIHAFTLKYLAPLGYVVGILLLVLTYFSPDIRGAARWIFVGPIQIQPSEVLKPFILLFFAWALSKRKPTKVVNVLLHAVLFLILALLIFKQPDLGTTIVYGASWLAMIFVAGIPFWILGLGAGAALGVAPIAWRLLEPFQKSRILTFINPAFDPQGAGYNALQAMIAVGSGQFFGRGFGRGTQSHLRFLPEYHTDFMFATTIEELGFIGGAIVFALYGVVLWRLIKPFVRQMVTDNVYQLYAVGLFAMIFTQIVVNTGMNMGIIPITGITLPFMSYGGSSIIALFTSFGIYVSLKRRG